MSTPGPGSIIGLNRFQALWQRCLLANAGDHSADIHQRLVNGYSEPQRHYHTLAHIEHCLHQFDQCKSKINNPDAVEIAIWFHDVIFQPGQPGNELNSAILYRELAQDYHQDSFCELVDEMIIATIHNGESLLQADHLYMVDIDLSSFGLPWEEFLRDGKNLRLESSHLSDAEYYQRQGDFQKLLLARERFYYTDFFYQLYETRARDNLSRYFEHLEH